MRTVEEIQKEYATWSGKLAGWQRDLETRMPVKAIKAEMRAAQARMRELKAEAADAVLPDEVPES